MLETVGVGQDEVEIARASDTTIVVSAPGLGDEVQAIKAGILEIADIHVVSKCDRRDAHRTLADLKQMLTLGPHTTPRSEWQVPVVGTSAVTGEGWFQKRIADFAYETALRKQSGEKPVIGVNKYVEKDDNARIATHPYDAKTAQRQVARTRRVRRERDQALVDSLLDKLVEVAKSPSQNIVPITIELVKAGATMGDIVERLKALWGTYRETPVF